MDHAGITLVEPLDYLAFLQLESKAKLVLTDSGGAQEETVYSGRSLRYFKRQYWKT
jgi:UDP-N-acetylglucosamine 2-epimerase (non-hydrolysing)